MPCRTPARYLKSFRHAWALFMVQNLSFPTHKKLKFHVFQKSLFRFWVKKKTKLSGNVILSASNAFFYIKKDISTLNRVVFVVFLGKRWDFCRIMWKKHVFFLCVRWPTWSWCISKAKRAWKLLYTRLVTSLSIYQAQQRELSSSFSFS